VLCRPDCISGQEAALFNLYSLLEGGFYSHQLTNWATSADPNLDLSPLLHSTVDQTGDGFRLTKIWEYDTFRGRLHLGRFAAGEPFAISYRMRAATYANMPAYETWTAAAINDPFHLSSDPLPPIEIARFDFVPVQPPPPPPPPPTDPAKVCLCHRTGNGSFKLLKVARPAVPAHRNHGDGLPGEQMPGRTGYKFDRKCKPIRHD
jgi:hypothetical protein